MGLSVGLGQVWSLLQFLTLVDLADVILERQALGTDWNTLHMLSLVGFSGAFLVAMRTPDRRFHGFLAVASLVVCLGWGIGGLGTPIVTTSGDRARRRRASERDCSRRTRDGSNGVAGAVTDGAKVPRPAHLSVHDPGSRIRRPARR